MGVIVVDSSVLISVLDDSQSTHQRAKQELAIAAQNSEFIIPAVAFSETLVDPYRTSLEQGRLVESRIRRLGRIEAVTEEISSRAAQLRAKRKLKLPDALIIATGIELHVSEILTFDKDWKTLDSCIRVLALTP
ncbi:MAG: type II toxin-antitoxin system VapC family toxin [Candidatus Dormibacteraceae bacterium]